MHNNIGTLIRNVLKERNLSVKDFAEQLGIKRPNAYRIFESNSIDTSLLLKISQILDYDFFGDISEDYNKNKKKG